MSGLRRHLPECVCREHPIDASMKVRDALQVYLAENGFTVEGYDHDWTRASFFGIPFWVPNTARHRWGIMLHDLHHVATGYGTDIPGEAEVSAWEVRREGMGALGPYVGGIILTGALLGMFVSPRRTVRAYLDSRSDVASLFVGGLASYEALLELTVGELRAHLGVPREGVFEGERKLHPDAPKTPNGAPISALM